MNSQLQQLDERLHLNLFGGISLSHRGVHLGLGKKQRAFLAYLAMSADGSTTRDRLVGVLWSESSEIKAKGNLRQVLKNARDQLEQHGYHGLTGLSSPQLHLQQDSIQIDVLEALTSIEQHTPHDCLLETKNIHETLMIGFEDLDTEFSHWLYIQRKLIKDRLTLAMENALSSSSITIAGRRKIAAALLNLDSSNEVAVRVIMRTYAEENNVAGALRVYEELVQLLDRKYGMDATAETEQLAVHIKLADHQSTGASDTLSKTHFGAAEDKALPELQIEPFGTESIPPGKVYIVNGFRHDLLASLARFRDWQVIEQITVTPPEQTTTAVNCRYILRAVAYQDGTIIHLICTVKDAHDGRVVWANKYRLQMESWFTIQQQIIRQLAIGLNIHISADRLANIVRHWELPAALHDRWLIGQDRFFRWRPDASGQAAEIFRQIIAEAPEFAPAYSSLVQFENSRHLIYAGVRRKPVDDLSTVELARQAVQIDPLDSKTHLCLAWSLSLAGRFEQAQTAFESASKLNENDPWTLVSTAQGFAFCADYKRAQELVYQADKFGLTISHLNCAYQVGTRFLYGDYQGAVEAAEKAADIISNIIAWKAAALTHLGMEELAWQEGQRFLALIRSDWHDENSEPTDSAIVTWLLHCFPIRQKADWQRLRDGLAGAGLPIPDNITAPH